jgi:hypothetical protein
MNILGDDLRIILSLASLPVSLCSLYFTRVNWLQSNRPIVVVYVTEHKPGNVATTFNLVVANTGNRPAVRVRLNASHNDILQLVEDGIESNAVEAIKSCFQPESEIPLLRNSEDLTTSFGFCSDDPRNGSCLRYGATTEIFVTYRDLEGRSYQSKQPLKIYTRRGFGGGTWSSSEI